MSEDKPFKEQIEEKKKNLFGDKKEYETNDPPEKPVEKEDPTVEERVKEVESETDKNKKEIQKEVLDSISTKKLFKTLKKRIRDKRAKILMEKAHEEYRQLKEKIGEVKAKQAVGKLLFEVVESKVVNAQAVEEGAMDGNR